MSTRPTIEIVAADCRVAWIEWRGSPSHPRPVERTADHATVRVRDGLATIELRNGERVRLSARARGFKFTEQRPVDLPPIAGHMEGEGDPAPNEKGREHTMTSNRKTKTTPDWLRIEYADADGTTERLADLERRVTERMGRGGESGPVPPDQLELPLGEAECR